MPIFKSIKKRNIKDFRRELARTHSIIALLSLATIALLSLGATKQISFDPTLSAVCVVLLLIITLFSTLTVVSLYRKK